jgi:hypothetical protein
MLRSLPFCEDFFFAGLATSGIKASPSGCKNITSRRKEMQREEDWGNAQQFYYSELVNLAGETKTVEMTDSR